MEVKQRASLFAVLCALALSFSKFSVGVASGSMTVVASGLDSLLDVFMSAMNFLAIKKADQPADREHHYGHGKAESIASSAQALIIVLTGCLIVYKAAGQFVKAKAISYSGMDLGVMCLSLVFSFIISFVLGRIGRRTDSNALKADALHYTSDLYSNSAAILAIILTYFTGKAFFDLLFAAITGVIIIVSAFRILKEGISGLMDRSIPFEVEEEIASIIDAMPFPYAGYHKLRTRSSGNKKYIDFHLLACRKLRIDEAHNLAHQIERSIAEKFATVDMLIHVEPCEHECGLSEATCTVITARASRVRVKARDENKEEQLKKSRRIER
jgi:cation diffusion facilitator family transporter